MPSFLTHDDPMQLFCFCSVLADDDAELHGLISANHSTANVDRLSCGLCFAIGSVSRSVGVEWPSKMACGGMPNQGQPKPQPSQTARRCNIEACCMEIGDLLAAVSLSSTVIRRPCARALCTSFLLQFRQNHVRVSEPLTSAGDGRSIITVQVHTG